MERRGTWMVAGVAGAVLALSPSVARASRHFHPFSYNAYTTPAHVTEFELALDAVPGTYPGYGDGAYFYGQVEIEHGITDRIEVSLYNTFEQAGSDAVRYDGPKIRTRFRFTPDDWAVQMAGYLEFHYAPDELELEEKLIVERDWGAFRLTANLWVEQEFVTTANYRFEPVIHPTLAAGYEFTPTLFLGAEYWLEGQNVPPDPMNASESFRLVNYLGPTFSVADGEWWMAGGVYFRMNHPDVMTTNVEDAQTYGPVWTRILLGVNF